MQSIIAVVFSIALLLGSLSLYKSATFFSNEQYGRLVKDITVTRRVSEEYRNSSFVEDNIYTGSEVFNKLTDRLDDTTVSVSTKSDGSYSSTNIPKDDAYVKMRDAIVNSTDAKQKEYKLHIVRSTQRNNVIIEYSFKEV